jgi:hypothetical protein
MENIGHNDPQNVKIQGLLARYLDGSSQSGHTGASGNHLDEDSLTAFTEGNLSEREALPIVNHLTECSFCRHVTTELVRLDLAFAETDLPTVTADSAEPASISSVLSGILSRIFGSGEAAVFAHEEKDTDEEETEDEKTEKSKE